ncbi:hypothetical protein [Kitasatospora cheerisanensis]|uniref:Uncharacterized protein n=1 Tax=Kitasatospora cheerisanensis KCTC 2395 TaxID=1348663 RepID=A0A066YKR4_9ACTN|nr:hypothetical protein [Kitasatospora cheerisanensis]KDN80524.1 hypothetical protein KCH_76710 [Kitasatospora cheerisanensis KCTC 2395]
MFGAWQVVEEDDRVRWEFDPLKSVGPLRFGMSYEDVLETLDGFLEPSCASTRHYGQVLSDEFYLPRSSNDSVLTLYYDAERLACVVVNALRGPQVTLDGLPLVGRVPSELESDFAAYTAARGHELRYSQDTSPGSDTLGVVLRAQRAGDVVLSRPVFVAPMWAERCGDVSEGPVPRAEWDGGHW